MDGPDGQVFARDDPEQVDQRHLALRGQLHPHVVPVRRVGPPIPVPDQTVRPELVMIGGRNAGLGRGGREGEWHVVEHGRFENPLRADHGDALPLESEALGENAAREDRPVDYGLVREKGERGVADFGVGHGSDDGERTQHIRRLSGARTR